MGRIENWTGQAPDTLALAMKTGHKPEQESRHWDRENKNRKENSLLWVNCKIQGDNKFLFSISSTGVELLAQHKWAGHREQLITNKV